MNRDDVIRVMMSIIPPDDFVDGSINEELLDEFMPLFEAIAADVKAKEREACVKLSDELRQFGAEAMFGPYWERACLDYAAAIQARK